MIFRYHLAERLCGFGERPPGRAILRERYIRLGTIDSTKVVEASALALGHTPELPRYRKHTVRRNVGHHTAWQR